MQKEKPVEIEMFYTLTCPNCRVLKRMLEEVLPAYGDKFRLKTTLANMPEGYVRTMKLGIFAVPTLLIDKKIVYREVPPKQDLIDKLNSY